MTWTPEQPNENANDLLDYAAYVKLHAEAYLLGNEWCPPPWPRNPASDLLSFADWFEKINAQEVKNGRPRCDWIYDKLVFNDA